MKKVIRLITVAIYIFAHQAVGQSLNIGVKTFYGTYLMNDLSDLQQELSEQIPVDSRVVQSFPGYIGHQLHMYLEFPLGFNIGVLGDMATTGGRVHYIDYSGEIRIDMVVKRKSIGFIYEGRPWVINEYLYFFGGAKATAIFSKLAMEEYLNVYSSNNRKTYHFTSKGFGIEPQIALEFKISRLKVRAESGCQFDRSKPFKSSNLRLNSSKGEVGPDWSGARVGLSLAYSFKKN